jgi:hypothetical protein
MVQLQKTLFALLRIALVLFAATLSRSAPAETVQAKQAPESQATNIGATEAPQGPSPGQKDDSGDDDDDDDDGEEQQ